jgi:hypothetical protein
MKQLPLYFDFAEIILSSFPEIKSPMMKLHVLCVLLMVTFVSCQEVVQIKTDGQDVQVEEPDDQVGLVRLG